MISGPVMHKTSNFPLLGICVGFSIWFRNSSKKNFFMDGVHDPRPYRMSRDASKCPIALLALFVWANGNAFRVCFESPVGKDYRCEWRMLLKFTWV